MFDGGLSYLLADHSVAVFRLAAGVPGVVASDQRCAGRGLASSR
jgi:hypothetical protein